MNINDSDMTPVGGGELRARPPAAEPVGTFTATASPSPDTIWNPRGREIAPADRPLPSAPAYTRAESERPVQRDHVGGDSVFSFHEVGAQTRAAVRGIAG